MTDLLIRFAIGGVVVSLFALIGDLLKPKSFAGLFSAAPSVALASLGLTIAKQGRMYASLECRSLVFGAIALGLYAAVLSRLLLRGRMHPLAAALVSLPVWFAAALALWCGFLREGAS
jgi:uncharacterized membrane protein (GlpM family)